MIWLEDARCVGRDPQLFDFYVFPQAKEALGHCNLCKVTSQCLDWVKPQKSHFDGVAGGIVWRNGYRVRADNSTREDRIIRSKQLRGEDVEATDVPEIYGQRTLPFD